MINTLSLNTKLYYINTNKTPGELSHENMISSQVKITCYFHMWKYHRCYGHIINGAFRRIKLFQWNGLVFHWCLYNKQNITWPLGHVENISLVRRAHSWNIFQHSNRNFVSLRGHVISSICAHNLKAFINMISYQGDPWPTVINLIVE